MTIIYQYAIVDTITEEVIGKYTRPFAPPKMQNIPYVLMVTNSHNTSYVEGTAFLSKAVKFWNVVSDPLYSTTPEQNRTSLKLEGFI
ncbi:hypothetical protein FDH34_gp406 [Serratia phage BF]|uniref:Uncharacterized protein n=3 Tax=Eneladusvirus BF TaxID=2560751 RepID=A0A7L8ZP08_9CAUD|nr:hypothetical protein FDH34_gp406 [Serratia phage BF]QOI71435.1 hypothetical protein pEaSNUABM12_00518 [Erwinia phage pEa_SNUABM_12]QOI71988.1 hypothetical protein pEaSNUABM47_00539 [Erwinia phage pEa_SNUABM_47]QXO11660.1 hypothetical protein pEaSNUABM19_00549 [Erwinia phage pEa_SNUABM_19]QXO12209.1 hypothetical protein pEaSNUABM44_00548 [Erwinia phage pEa_SNUABM_44]AQW89039.1 hypothetical protein BF_0514 [Serratia phage BF]